LDSGLGRPQLSLAANCFARELVSPSLITIQFSQEVIATFEQDNNGVSPIQICQQIISFEAQIRQRIISLQNGDNEGASPALGSLPISWKGSVALPAISNEGAASAQGLLSTSFSNEGASPALGACPILDSNEGICSSKRLMVCFFSSALHENALFLSRRSTEGVTMLCQLGHFSYKIIYGGIAPSAITNNWLPFHKLLQFCFETRIAFVSEQEMCIDDDVTINFDSPSVSEGDRSYASMDVDCL
jgi:hypothetical protein